jgi:hypothetical protein
LYNAVGFKTDNGQPRRRPRPCGPFLLLLWILSGSAPRDYTRPQNAKRQGIPRKNDTNPTVDDDDDDDIVDVVVV